MVNPDYMELNKNQIIIKNNHNNNYLNQNQLFNLFITTFKHHHVIIDDQLRTTLTNILSCTFPFSSYTFSTSILTQIQDFKIYIHNHVVLNISDLTRQSNYISNYVKILDSFPDLQSKLGMIPEQKKHSDYYILLYTPFNDAKLYLLYIQSKMVSTQILKILKKIIIISNSCIF